MPGLYRNLGLLCAIVLLSLLGTSLLPARGPVPPLSHGPRDTVTGASLIVQVGAVPQVVTTQLLPTEEEGQITGDITTQSQRLLVRLREVLKPYRSDLPQVAKLNVYVRETASAPAAVQTLLSAWPEDARPALSLVTTPLPDPQALVALDAIAVTEAEGVQNTSRAALLPVGERIYISGQAEAGNGTLVDATRKTLASLDRTMQYLGVQRDDVVQIKAFLQPMAQVADVEAVYAEFFPGQPLPPTAYVEWQAPRIEIELVVSDVRTTKETPPAVTYLTPPGMTASPLFARVTRVAAAETLYLGGVFAPESGTPPDAETRVLFTRMQHAIEHFGGDLKHLAKATYYVADNEISAAHNRIRPEFFDPERPPAASKAAVLGAGWPGRRITLDMIAVPAE